MFWCCCGGSDVRIEKFVHSFSGYSQRFLHNVTNLPYTGPINVFDRNWYTQIVGTDSGVAGQYRAYGIGLRYYQSNVYPQLPDYRSQAMNWCTIIARIRANAGQTIQNAVLLFDDTNRFDNSLGGANYDAQPLLQVNVWASRKQFVGLVEPPTGVDGVGFQFSAEQFSPNPFPFDPNPINWPYPWTTYNTRPTGWNAFNGPWMTTVATGTTGRTWSVDVTAQVQEYLNAATVANGYMLFLIAPQHPSQVWYDSGRPAEGPSNPLPPPFGRLHTFDPLNATITTPLNYLQITV